MVSNEVLESSCTACRIRTSISSSLGCFVTSDFWIPKEGPLTFFESDLLLFKTLTQHIDGSIQFPHMKLKSLRIPLTHHVPSGGGPTLLIVQLACHLSLGVPEHCPESCYKNWTQILLSIDSLAISDAVWFRRPTTQTL